MTFSLIQTGPSHWVNYLNILIILIQRITPVYKYELSYFNNYKHVLGNGRIIVVLK